MTIATQVTLFEGLAALAVMPPAARLWAAGRKREVVRLLSDLSTGVTGDIHFVDSGYNIISMPQPDELKAE